MEITVNTEGKKVTITAKGDLDINSAPDLEKEIRSNLDGMETVVLDFAGVDYVSSAGLRVLLVVKKLTDGKSKLRIENVNDKIMEIMDVTGFSRVLSIQSPK